MRVAKAAGRDRAPWCRQCAAGAVALVAMLAGSAWGAQAASSFSVTVDLHTASTGTCLTSPEAPSTPSVVTIDCRSTQPKDPVDVAPPTSPSGVTRAYRFMIPTGNGALRYGGVDMYAGAGTITSWRVVHLTDWDYLEMTVGW